MPDENLTHSASVIWSQVLTDAHFWIPLIVLAGGLAVLYWIH